MPGKRILIVDDEADVLDLSRRVLETQGYNVRSTYNAYKAIEIARNEDFDLLLTDIKMPGMSGLELAQTLREFNPNLICVLMTGFSTMDMAIVALNLGIDAYILKPFTPEEVSIPITNLFEKVRLRKEIFRHRSLSPIFELNKIIMNAVEANEISKGLLNIVKEEIGADFAAICILRSDEIIFYSHSEIDEMRLRVSSEFSQPIFQDGQQLSISQDRVDSGDQMAILELFDASFALITPFKSGVSTFSALILTRKARMFSPVDIEFVRVLAAQASMGIETLEPHIGISPIIFERNRLVNRIEVLQREQASSWIDLSQRLQESERRVAHLRKERDSLKRQLDRSKDSSEDKFSMSELNDLTVGIVHDMRNGLGIIGNTLSFLEDDLADPTHKSDILKISRSLDYCDLVLRNLSTLSERDNFKPQSINVEIIGRQVYFLLERKLVDIDLVVDSNPNVPEISADEGQMKQVFMNLIKNAGEAMPNGGTLALTLRRDENILDIKLSDTGYGISQRNQKRLFRKFFTTKDRGYGLGLYIVKDIIKRHNGTIAVESELNKGTTFTIRLPIEVG